MAKVLSSKKTAGVTGGSGKMFGKQSSGTQKPGQSAQMGRGGKAAQGGKGHMFGPQKAKGPKAC